MKYANYKNILRGVSTLDVMKKYLIAPFLLIIFTAFSLNVSARGGHSTLDLVDPSFNPQIQTNEYGFKWVNAIEALPDGKILALGGFNSFNGVPVGKLIRLNPDGSLDTTFNNQTVTGASSFQTQSRIVIQPDGKIIVRCDGLVAGGQPPKRVIRLNADGSLDPTFNYTRDEFIYLIYTDSLGRLTMMGDFTTPNGSRRLIRINDDGSLDNSFNFVLPAGTLLQYMSLQGDKPIVYTTMSGGGKIYRLNEDGSADSSFTPVTVGGLIAVQPDNKILYGTNGTLLRLNENGSSDDTFQATNVSQGIIPNLVRFTSDGKIVTMLSSSPGTFRRYSANGGIDPSFTPFTITNFAAYTIQFDDNIVMGDGMMGGIGSGSSVNNFLRLLSGGTRDVTFNPGSTGFQIILPSTIKSIESQPDGKVLLGGKFDLINNVSSYRIARLNADSTIDNSFQINTTSGSGNYFSIIRDVYQIRVQPDGKMVVSGYFDYFLNGELKQNLVRLNSNGSIDAAFNLTYLIPDYSQINFAGRNRFSILSDGKLMVGTSRNDPRERPGPIKLTAGGAYDTSFNSTLNSQYTQIFIEDLAIQPDGKVIVAGFHSSPNSGNFIARLDTDGTPDPTFTYAEEPGRFRMNLIRLPNGKILISKSNHPNGGSARIQRLNSNGSVDSSFNPLLLSDSTAKINALLVLPDDKFFIGGKFMVTVNGQERKNLLQLSADGNIETTVYNVNEEVLCLAADSEGRVLVGGGFTVIGANGGSANRSYVARLTDSSARFDFDGDGRSDLGAFTPSNGKWTIHHSNAAQTFHTIWGLPDDKLIPADYDGDGKTDIAVFRPSNGLWYMLRSRDGYAEPQWGLPEDKPVAADYDGDGVADLAVWRPSSRVWYVRHSSTGQVFTVQFGLSDDIPLADADFDGDGKADIAVWRPSNGAWYWLASGSGNQFHAVQFGLSGDVPAVGDYNGDGKTDLVVFRPAEGNWYQYLSSPNASYTFATFNFGLNGDEPIAADYDGDGKTDIAVRRQNVWHINRSGQGYTSVAFAGADDKAVASSLNR